MADALTVLPPLARAEGALLQRVRTLTALPLVQRALPLVGLGVLVLLAILAVSAFNAPARRALLPGMNEADKAAVASALDTAGMSYSIDGTSGALNVAEPDYHKARMLLAAQGLPKAAPTGMSGLDAMPLGASEAVERERLQGAREADLARTIEAIDAVDSARVHLAVEAPSLFVRDRAAPRASVMITLRSGRSLSDAQTSAIANLVSSSVPGLPADGVAVIDQGGRLLSTPDGAAGALAGQLAVQQRVEARYREALATVLTPLVGVDGFSAEVHADLDFAAVDATRETYPEASRALTAEDQKITTERATAPAVGIPGVLSNTAPPASTISTGQPVPAAAAMGPGTTSQDISRRFQLGREVSVTRNAPGALRRLSLAVALREVPGKRRTQAELQAIETLVRGAVGFDAARGDVVAVSARPFVAEVKPVSAWYEAGWIATAAKLGGLAVAALLGWWFVGRRLLRRYDAATVAMRRGEAAALIEQQLAENPAQTPGPVTLDMIESAPGYEHRAALVRDYVRQDPARAAQVLRAIIAAEAGA